MVIANLKDMVTSAVDTSVAVQETLDAKQEVIDKVDEAQELVDNLNQSVTIKKQEIVDLTEIKKQEILDEGEVQTEFVRDVGEEVIQEFDEHALHRTNQYDSNHTTKLAAYNENDSIKMTQYNENHIERLENINYAYADRIVDLINTKKLLGVIDQYTAQKPTKYAYFLDTTDPDYLYYLNGVRIIEGADYLIVDSKIIELMAPIEAHDVILQISPTLLAELLIHKQVLTEPMKGIPNGVASLDSNGHVPAIQLPSYVDDVIEVPTHADLPVEGEFHKIYVVVEDETEGGDTSTYRWTGTMYALVSNTLTAEDVKALYESNADTNALTDLLLDKLNNIEPNAQVNVVTSVAGKIGDVLLTNTDVGLENVKNIDTTNASNITLGTLPDNVLANSGVTVGEYTKVAVDEKGRVTNGSAPINIADLGITNVYNKTEVDTCLNEIRHNQLRARDDANSHPIEAISGLVEALSDLQENIDIITRIEEW